MKFNLKKVATILGSAIMLGSTVGLAAAASVPSSFASSGIAVVVGSGNGVNDAIAASAIQADLLTEASASAGTGSTTTTVTGDAVALDTGSTKIWLNTSLNTAKTLLTKTDLPTVLEETTFSGNVDSKLTSTISVGTNKVTFAKQPSSSDDPVLGISLGSAASAPLYSAVVTMPAVSFNNTDSEGETIHLFGKDFVVSTATDGTNLVLFSSAQEVSLTAGGSDPNPTADVVIDGVTYTVTLITGDSGTPDSATISVNGDSKEVNEGSSKKIGGIDIAVKSVTESTALSTVTASILVGSSKLTFTSGTQVLMGSDDDPIDGTLVTFTGTPFSLTGLNVTVYAPDTSNDAILAGESFVDPVFGSFKVDFSGMNVPLDSSARDSIKVDKAGDKGMSLTLTDDGANAKTFDFVYNASTTFLGDSNSYRIAVREGATLFQNNYTMVGNQDYGHLVQVTRIYNNTGSDYTKDAVTFEDVISGETYNADFTAEGSGRVTIDGHQYTITNLGSGDSGNVTLKYPTSDSSATQYVLFPNMKTEQGALVALYEPQNISLSTQTGFLIPDGDDYGTAVTVSYAGNATTGWENVWSIGGYPLNTSSASNGTAVTVGQLVYHINGTSTNNTMVRLVNPQTSVEIAAPAVILTEAKDDSSNYESLVVQVEANAAGTSSDPVGVADVSFTSPTLYSATLQSDSDITQSVDWWGTLVTEDSNTASQAVATISYPKEQVLANVFVGATSATVSSDGGAVANLGVVTVRDSEVSSVSSKNLIVVGGSCINSVAAELLGGAACGDSFTTKTGIKAGEAMIKSFARSGKIALLVAGYNAVDTEHAATYFTNNVINTTVGAGLKVTSATAATALTA